MSYFGSYFGGTVTTVLVTPPDPPDPVESPLPDNSPEFIDHISAALDRLCEYAKAKKP